jgi:acyl-CoA thioester hydrolase
MKQFNTYRGFVYPWCIDHLGHMNVQHYVAKFDEASWHLLAAVGLSPSFLAAHDKGLVALDQRIQYRQEVLAGSLLDVTTELVEIHPKKLRFIHHMRNSETSTEVAIMDLLVAYFDKSTRRTAALPDVVAARARAALSDGPLHTESP